MSNGSGCQYLEVHGSYACTWEGMEASANADVSSRVNRGHMCALEVGYIGKDVSACIWSGR